MRWILSLAFFLFLSTDQALGQELDLLSQLEIQLQQGQKRALRDVGILLDEPGKRAFALHLLSTYTLFETAEIPIDSQLNKATFVNFFYDNFENIHFSPLLSAYYIKPVERQENSLYFSKHALSFPSIDDWWLEVEKIDAGKLSLVVFLQSIIQDTRTHPNPDQLTPIKLAIKERLERVPDLPTKAYELYGEWATWFTDEGDFTLLLDWTQSNRLSPKLAYTLLARLTNHVFPDYFGKKEPLIQAYRERSDTLGSLSSMIRAGYSSYIDFSPTYFPDRVHFLGKIISIPDCPPWIFQNALKELKAVKQPIFLFFLAGKFYQSRLDLQNPVLGRKDWIESLQRLSQVSLYLDNHQKAPLNLRQLDQLSNRKKFLIFWADQYANFSWNPSCNCFEHNQIVEKEKEIYTAWFEQLSAVNDSIALDAWYKIIEGPENLVSHLSEIYREKSPNLNKSLPPWRYDLLTIANQLVLTDPAGWLAFQKNDTEQRLLEELTGVQSDSALFKIEKQLIQVLPPEQITGMEIWALSHSNDDKINLACYHIIRHAYHNNLCYFWKNEANASLFLRKASILEPYQDYEQFVQLEEKCIHGYVQLDENRFSSDIRKNYLRQKLAWQIRNDPEKAYKSVDLLDQIEISQLPALDNHQIGVFFDAFVKIPAQQRDALKVYLTAHLKEESIPYLFKLLHEKIETAWVLVCLENFYDQKKSGTLQRQRRKWLQKWKKEKRSPDQLGKTVWREKFERLKSQSNPPESAIQWIVNSPYFIRSEKENVLKIIQATGKPRLIYRLQFPEKLHAADLHFFENMEFDLFALDNLETHFDPKAVPQLFDFMTGQLHRFGEEEKVIFFSEQLKKSHFRTYLRDDQKEALHQLMSAYLENVSFITEGEEQNLTWLIFWSQHGNKPIKEQLSLVEKMQVNPLMAYRLKENILASVTWNDIPALLQEAGNLFETGTFPLPNFIQDDFGLPTGDLSNENSRKLLATDMVLLSKRALYVKAFKKVGIELEDNQGHPNLTEIYLALSLAPDYSFAGKGGILRDYPYFGMIKYLETVFQEDFGFPEKLNADSPLRKNSILPRVQPWLQYLRPLVQSN